MAVRFESITFNIKDVVLIIGGTVSLFTFFFQMDNRMDAFELKMQEIVSNGAIEDVRINAKIEGLKHANNTNQPKVPNHFVTAIIPESNIVIKRKKLFEFKLI